MKKVLFISYHNSDNKNVQSTALVRRVSQYESFFKEKGFEIDYIITRNNEIDINNWSNRTLEISINKYFDNKFINKIYIFFIMVLYGDIIGYSFYKNRKKIYDFLEGDYHLIISFFTPRGTIWLGNRLKKKLNVTWWVDLQDSLIEGLEGYNLSIGIKWLKNKLSIADEIIHVSPEWANEDFKHIQKKIGYFRHCIPELGLVSKRVQKKSNSSVKIIYAGNIHFNAMDPTVLASPLTKFKNRIEFQYAGIDPIAETLIKMNIPVKKLGHLEQEQLNEAYIQADVILILAWNKEGRKVIPSKFYEACAYKKPIIIVGHDTGAFQVLFKEWGHPNVINDSESMVEEALNGFLNNNLNNFFCIENCMYPISDRNSFVKYLDNLLIKHS
jgi:hypothetical protein